MPKMWTPYDVNTPLVGELHDVGEIEKAYKTGRFNGVLQVDEPGTYRTYAQVAQRFMDLPDRDTYLWRVLNAALYEYHDNPRYQWKPQYQGRGTCVGQGFKLAVDVVMSVNWLLGESSFKGRAAVAPIYAGSRVEVAGRVGGWDGSNGSWASKWLVNWGVVLLDEMDLPDDSRSADERLAVRWAASRSGVPSELETLAREKPILDRVLITNAREAGKAIQAGNPVVQCSRRIPSSRRNSGGFASVGSGGGHCTCFTAVRYNPFGLLYQNSWGEWGSGGVFPDDQPVGSVWVSESDANRMLSAQDSYCLIGMTGLDPLPDDELYLAS